MTEFAFNHVGGIQKLSLIDFPGVPAIVLFQRGCNLHCPYCHNPDLTVAGDMIPPAEVKKEVQYAADHGVEGIVFTGGEPLIRPLVIMESIFAAKKMGLKVKLDTNGIAFDFEDVLSTAIETSDYVAVDYKLPLDRYSELNPGLDVCTKGLELLLKLLKRRDPSSYEVRTTVCPALLCLDDLKKMSWLVDPSRWYLQQFRSEKCLDSRIEGTASYSDNELAGFARELGCNVRGLKEDVG